MTDVAAAAAAASSSSFSRRLPLSSRTGAASQPAMATARALQTPGEPMASRQQQHLGPTSPGPDSPRGRLRRKRAASINTEEANHPRLEDLSLDTPNGLAGDSRRDLICLCTPAPKVPRPRNAFILYRQHHQAQVVAQHPGLANPDISKIIGEQWREQPEQVKNYWKGLAEEEKKRHQRQYPDYRYQPRRGGKAAGTRPGSSHGDDSGRCPKCGGRYIATPRTPSAPYNPLSTPVTAKPTMTPFMTPTTRGFGEADHFRMQQHQHHQQQQQQQHSGMSINTTDLGRGGGGGRPQYTTPQSSRVHDLDDDYEMLSPTPDMKRRRYNMSGGGGSISYASAPPPGMGAYMPMPPRHRATRSSISGSPLAYANPHGHGQQQQQQQQLYHHPGNSPLPAPGMVPTTGPMAPPPPPPPHAAPPAPARGGSLSYASPRSNSTAGQGAYDESLRLPPLQTALPLPTSPTMTSSDAGGQGQSQGQGVMMMMMGGAGNNNNNNNNNNALASAGGGSGSGSGVAAMVMSIRYLNKLRVLGKISPPLAAPAPGAPPPETRGPVIAVEGAHAAAVAAVGRAVERALAASGECEVRLWADGRGDGEDKAAEEVEMRVDAPAAAAAAAAEGGKPEGVGAKAKAKTNGGGGGGMCDYLRDIVAWHAHSDEMVRHITTRPGGGGSGMAEPPPAGGNSNAPISKPRAPKIPVALLPAGFSLTLSDRYASTLPIADSYAPVDHWQWMATLWRGIVGPDLVVYVRPAEGSPPSGGGGGGGGGNNINGAPDDGGGGAVEFKDAGVMAVRLPRGGALDEKTERRLAFEVIEWVRGGSYKGGV